MISPHLTGGDGAAQDDGPEATLAATDGLQYIGTLMMTAEKDITEAAARSGRRRCWAAASRCLVVGAFSDSDFLDSGGTVDNEEMEKVQEP